MKGRILFGQSDLVEVGTVAVCSVGSVTKTGKRESAEGTVIYEGHGYFADMLMAAGMVKAIVETGRDAMILINTEEKMEDFGPEGLSWLLEDEE